MFKSRPLAIAGSIAALSFAAVPIAQAAAATHAATGPVHVDRTRDASGDRHDNSRDRHSIDASRDVRDR
jgi:hypothetical protein